MHLIELIGSSSAISIFRDEEMTITKKTKDPVPAMCRVLIEMGLDGHKTILVLRDGTSVWKNNKTAGEWAAIDIHENNAGIRWRKHEPYSGKDAPLS